MNPVTPPPVARRRSVGWWIALGTGLLLTPLIVLGFAAISMMTLDRDAAFLRREVMAATDTMWHTKVQVSAGWITLGAVRTAMRFIQAEHMDDARLAMKAVRRASVGVYESKSGWDDLSVTQLFNRTDQAMSKRGWSRMVGVADHDETVLIYASDRIGSSGRIDLCLAVVDGNQLVVVSTNVDANAIAELAAKHIPQDGLRGKLQHAKLSY